MPIMWSLRPNVINVRAFSPKKLTFAKKTWRESGLVAPFGLFHGRLRFLLTLPSSLNNTLQGFWTFQASPNDTLRRWSSQASFSDPFRQVWAEIQKAEN